MPILSTILLCLLLLIVLAVLYLLLVPIDLSVTGTLDEEGARARGMVTWGVAGFLAEQRQGDLRTAVCLLGHPFWFSMRQGPQADQKQPERSQPAGQDGKRTAEKGGEEMPETGPPAAGETIAMVQEAWPRITDLLEAICKALEIRVISIRMIFGLNDAAGTGEVFGFLMALRGILSPLPWFSMTVTPDFCTTIFAGTFLGTLRLNHPGTLLVPVTRLMLSRPVRRLIRAQRGA